MLKIKILDSKKVEVDKELEELQKGNIKITSFNKMSDYGDGDFVVAITYEKDSDNEETEQRNSDGEEIIGAGDLVTEKNGCCYLVLTKGNKYHVIFLGDGPNSRIYESYADMISGEDWFSENIESVKKFEDFVKDIDDE